MGKGTADRELDAVFVEALEGNDAPPERLEQGLLFDADAGAEDADHKRLRNHTGFRILMRKYPGRRLRNAGIEEQVTGEDRRDACQDGQEGRPGLFRRVGLIPLRHPGEREVPGRGTVRDFDLTRGEEEELSKELGIPISEVMQGGDDKTLWCRSLASGAVGLNQPIPDHAWLWLKTPSQASATPTKISVTFEGGVPVALNGDELPLPEIVSKLNVIAGSHGIGKIDIFEDGIMGLKSRELYEAPAAAVLLKLHHDLEQFTLTKEELDFKAAVDQKWAYLVYHGAWFSPLKQALDAFIQTTQANVNGTLTANLFHGTIDLESRQSDHTLFFPEIRGLQSRSFNQQLCGPAAQIGGLPWEVLAKRMSKVSH